MRTAGDWANFVVPAYLKSPFLKLLVDLKSEVLLQSIAEEPASCSQC